MSRQVTFGLGGWCERCDETHDHPLHNIVEIIETPDDLVAEAQAWATAQQNNELLQ